jgi:hypothetical protein
MGRWVACTLLLAACSFKSAETPDDGRKIDAPHDGPPTDVRSEGTVDPLCFDAHLDLGHFCLAVQPANDIHITADNTFDAFNTSSDPLCDPQIHDFCVIAGPKVQIDASHLFLVKGSLPLVIVSQSTMQIDGTLDVSSHRVLPANNRGPDASPGSGCTGVSPGGHGGGYGGSFGTLGGVGGSGGGNPPALITATTLRGGCSGSDGGGNGGQRANGGGAVYLIAVTNIVVTGMIDASGAGAGGASGSNGGNKGGGGGGAGGMVVFDAPSLSIQGSVFANGGGGGEGSDFMSGGSAFDPFGYMAGGLGGSGASGGGGDGGDGAAGTSNGATGGDGGGGNGGGGGGGGVGVIYTYGGTTTSTQVSPPAVAGP